MSDVVACSHDVVGWVRSLEHETISYVLTMNGLHGSIHHLQSTLTGSTLYLNAYDRRRRGFAASNVFCVAELARTCSVLVGVDAGVGA